MFFLGAVAYKKTFINLLRCFKFKKNTDYWELLEKYLLVFFWNSFFPLSLLTHYSVLRKITAAFVLFAGDKVPVDVSQPVAPPPPLLPSYRDFRSGMPNPPFYESLNSTSHLFSLSCMCEVRTSENVVHCPLVIFIFLTFLLFIKLNRNVGTASYSVKF